MCLDTKNNNQQFRGFFPPKLFARSQEFYLLQARNVSLQAFLSLLSSSQLSRSEETLPQLPTTPRHCSGLAPRCPEGALVTAAPGCPSRALPAHSIPPAFPALLTSPRWETRNMFLNKRRKWCLCVRQVEEIQDQETAEPFHFRQQVLSKMWLWQQNK